MQNPITVEKAGYAVFAIVLIVILGLFKKTAPLALWMGALILLSMIVMWYPRWSYLIPGAKGGTSR